MKLAQASVTRRMAATACAANQLRVWLTGRKPPKTKTHTVVRLADLDFEPIFKPGSEPKPGQFPKNLLFAYKVAWLIMSKTKPELVDHVAEMDDATYEQVLTWLEQVRANGQADLDIATAALTRVSAAAVLALEKTAGKGKRP